jgi:hypothetical protein
VITPRPIPRTSIPAAARDEIEAEGLALLAFAAPESEEREVRVASPG